ncbi:MAG: tRNA1(Val) (adenine(37)-N6)-methyltransferase [Deltaproteobacteria bacterium]|nr:tRNA1(Val) (adenine(37)-N6)-methyltransferase [Deltaproteobacteria bacterium]
MESGYPAGTDPSILDDTHPSAKLETVDRVFDGRVAVVQRRDGYRFSLDSLLLARFVEARGRAHIVDLGAGNGVVALSLAVLHHGVEVVGVELQEAMVDRARRGVDLNGVGERVRMVMADVRGLDKELASGSFDVAVCNPPYRPRRSGRVNPDAERLLARHEVEGGLADFVRAGASLLRHRGRMCLVYPAERAVELFSMMRRHRLEPRRVRFVHSFADAPATLVLAEGVKGARTGLTVVPPLVIYRGEDAYTDETAGLLKP